MDTDYDRIAGQYKQAKLQPWRTHAECYTFLRLVGDVTGKAVLDLACGEGYYTRRLRQRGAARVVGVDLSHGMIELARAQEAQAPLGIEYRIEDVKRLALTEQFDLVVAAYLLNYAQTGEEMLEMCRAIAGALKPGGRFVTVNSYPDQIPGHSSEGRAYGYLARVCEELKEGTPVVWTFFLGDGSIEVTNYYLSVPTMEEVFRKAGLSAVRWHAPEVSPEGVVEFGSDHWANFLKHPPVTFIECVKGERGASAP
jgi:ubiquinone/menaquinone biosynthesis C-methylase UbiE